MKKIICSMLLVCLVRLSHSQTTTQNFIKKTTPISAVTTEAALTVLGSGNKVESISYIDGLGRTLQDVLISGSPSGNDVIQPYYYDQYGRQSIELLPYTSSTGSGTYRDQAYDAQPIFYTNATTIAKSSFPYSETIFDGSPLNNVLEKSAPDTDWKIGNGHTSKTETSYNQESDWILKWTIQSNGDVTCSGYDDNYGSNMLQKIKYTDPQGNYSFIFTDKSGKTVCAKQFLEIKTVGQLQIPYYLTTYLVYDDFDQLVCVIPPKAMDVMDASGNYSINALAQDFVFKYKYDERHRLIEKKVPGTSWSYIVYNQLNQPVLFQDGNLNSQGKWSFIKYDVLGRPIMSGLYTSSLSRITLQNTFNGNQTAIGESEVPLDVNNPYGYTNVTLPLTNLDILTVNYYDDYDFDNNGINDYSFNTTSIPCLQVPNGGKQLICIPYTNIASTRTRGFLTGSRIKVLDASNPVQWEVAAVFYDDKGQAIQSQSNDHMGGIDLINMVYDFVGNVVHTQQLHSLSGQSNIQVLNHMYYDKMGRLTRVEQKNNNDAAIALAAYNYNELSQVIEKNVHRVTFAAGSNYLQSMDYRYNIQGWLTSINNIDLSSDMATNPLTGTNDDTNDLWGMQLNYNTNTTGVNGTKQYAGNVSEKKWRSITDNIIRAYGYDYDKADRLKKSAYVEYNTGSSLWNNNIGRYDEKDIVYDANGNITALKRYGCQTSGSSFGLIDNLTYQYNGNFLGSVTDASATQGYLADFKDNGSNINNEYTYDANGNLTSNPNKKITSIVYNHLNLPTQINFSGTGVNKIEYTYDAAGTRLTKKVTQTTTNINIRKYASVFEYNMANTQPLEFMHTSEGRCVPTNASGTLVFRYEYQYNDNTGNVVMAFTDMDNNGTITPASEVIQQSSYYAFGMRMEGLNTSQIGTEHKYKFSSKEFNDDLGLNEYDFGARFYDPAIARWGCIDPMADAAPNWTPFRYGFNNPITVTDPTGMLEGLDWEGNVTSSALEQIEDIMDSNLDNDGDGGKKGVLYNKHGLDSKYDSRTMTISFEGDALAPGDLPVTSDMMANILAASSGMQNMPTINATSLDGGESTPDIIGDLEIKDVPEGNLGTQVLDGVQTGLDVVGLIPGIGEIADGINAAVYTARGDYVNAGLSAAAMIPFAGWAATGGKLASKTVKYTKSNMKLGQEIHKAYKAGLGDGLTKFKEFRDIPGIRPDFVDFGTKTIYELKPFNPRGIKSGEKQLNKYKTIFEDTYGGTWNTVLDHY